MSKNQKLPNRFAEAIERLDGDERLLREMAAITSADLPDVIRETEMALAEGDCEHAASGLHKLKGMLSTFESNGVTLEIQEMLDLARKEKAEQAHQEYEQHKATSGAQASRRIAATRCLSPAESFAVSTMDCSTVWCSTT